MRRNARWNREQWRLHCCVVLLVSADSRCLFQILGYWTGTGRGWDIAGTAFGREEFAALAKK